MKITTTDHSRGYPTKGQLIMQIRADGVQAFVDGHSDDISPYAIYTEEGAAWLRGWNTARYGAMLADKERNSENSA